MITMNVFSDNHYKCNLPIVGSEGEKPVGQNPVVGQPDPRYLSSDLIKVTMSSLTASCSTLVMVQWSLAVPPDQRDDDYSNDADAGFTMPLMVS